MRRHHELTLLAAVVSVLAIASCSSDKQPRLARDCEAVFGVAATGAAGTCHGSFRAIHITGTDCVSGPRLMLAETADGSDYAWARAGQGWHLLSEDGTNMKPYQACVGH